MVLTAPISQDEAKMEPKMKDASVMHSWECNGCNALITRFRLSVIIDKRLLSHRYFVSSNFVDNTQSFLTTLGLSQATHWLQVSLMPVAVWFGADFFATLIQQRQRGSPIYKCPSCVLVHYPFNLSQGGVDCGKDEVWPFAPLSL